jgi:WD40 repeat protein
VQETLVLLWERLERRFLPLRAYEALVLPLSAYQRRPGVKCTGLQVALARRADAALAELTPVQQAIARRIFLRLIQFGEGRADTRRQQPVAALRSSADPSGEFDQTLEHLARSRLLTLTGEEGRGDSLAAHAVYPGPLGRARAGFPVAQRKADIAHEALIAGWPTLQGWLTERREAEQTRRRLEGKVVEWTRLSKIPVRGGRSAGGLLDAVELREATRWLASPDAADLGYDAALPTLIQVSGRALRQAFWLRAGSLAAAIIIIIAAIAIYAFQQRAAAQREATLRQQVEEQLAISRSRQVAAVARNRLDEGAAQQALLLGIAATQQITETAESANVLREALDAWRGEAVLEGHAKRVSHVAFSPNGQYLASISDDQTARLWQMSGDRRALVLRGHTADLTAVLFSADSRWLITAGRDSTARVWDVTSGETTHILNHGGAVTSLALSPDGQTVAAGDEDNAIWLWDLASGQPARAEPFRAEGAIQDVTFSPNGIFLVAASADNTAWLWHLPSGQFVRLTGFPAAVRKVAFSPDGRYLAACGGDLVQMWDMDGLKAVELKSPQHAAQIHGLAFSPDNRHLATASQDATVRLWDLRRLDIDPLILRGHTEAVWSVLFSPDGRILATMGWDDRVRLWRVGDGALETLLVGHTAEIWDSAFSPDGQLPQRGATLLATPDSAGVVRLWRAQAGGDVARHAARGQPTTALALVGTQVAVAGDDGIVELWRPDTDATQVYTATSGRLEALAASPDATLLATGGVDGQITLLDVGDPRQGAATGTALTRWPAHTAAVRSLLFLPDGVHLASAGADRTIRLWDLRKPGASQPVRELRGHTNDVTALAAGPTPGDLVSAGGDGTVRVWDWQTGQLQTQFDAGQPLLAVAVSPDRRYLAAGGYGAAVYVWSLATPGAEPVLLSHGTPVRALAFSPDGRRLGSGAEDGALRLWDLTNPRPGQPVVVRGHGDRWVVGLAFSADGRTLFSAGGDGQTHAWPAPTADALALGCRRAGRNLTLAEWQTYLAFTPFVKVCPEEAAASWTLGPRLDQPRPASAAAGPASLPLTADPRPIIRYFEALPGSTLPAAGSVTLRWDVAGAAALYLEYDGQRRGVTAPHEESFTPAADTVYRLIAINAAGERALEIKVVVAH